MAHDNTSGSGAGGGGGGGGCDTSGGGGATIGLAASTSNHSNNDNTLFRSSLEFKEAVEWLLAFIHLATTQEPSVMTLPPPPPPPRATATLSGAAADRYRADTTCDDDDVVSLGMHPESFLSAQKGRMVVFAKAGLGALSQVHVELGHVLVLQVEVPTDSWVVVAVVVTDWWVRGGGGRLIRSNDELPRHICLPLL
jgi:hypothetical protein